jgi:HdeA/HdeB family
MSQFSAKITAITVMLGTAFITGSPAAAQNQLDRTIEQFKCRDVMREPSHEREVAIAFLHGYLLGKSGQSKFNIEELEKQTDGFIDQCLDNPQAKAEDVMLKLKK